MTKKSLHISIGIAAYNEEKNIRSLLKDLLSQSEEGFALDKIFVSCDGCNDRTAEFARSVDGKKVVVFDNKDRQGKTRGLQQVIDAFESDIIVLFDADVKLANQRVLTSVVNMFLADKKTVLVGGNTEPFAPRTFFERAVYSTFIVFQQSRRTMHGGHNIYGCNGGCMAIEKSFAKSLHLPAVANDDDFIYFTAKAKGLQFRHTPDATVYYKLPTHLSDFLKQSFRSDPQAVVLNMEEMFGDIVAQEYQRPVALYAKFIWNAFKRYPLETIYIMFVRGVCLPLYPLITRNYKLDWFTATSTK
jgi:glycosyltransferase involved in cell wall biosynthesis